ncbi:hypothetical protein IM538_20380 [Cytobacillus suaedae]|nr:hypothetical protein IM538_20380 [Cytobacillus suaedae]
MNLENLLTNFLERLYELEHVVLLLPNEPLVITFDHVSMGHAYLYLSSTRSYVTNTFEEHISIMGNGIMEFINGTSKLTDLINQENIEVVGSLRNTLLLEAIFYLSHEKDMRNIG